MTRARLGRVPREDVTLLVGTPGPLDDLLEPGPLVWTPGPTLESLVTPLGLEETVKAGLSTDRDRLRVQLPPISVGLPGRVRLRGSDWAISKAEHWPSYTLLIVEGV